MIKVLLIDFKLYKMTEKVFFDLYIPALEEALRNDYINYGFNVLTPNWYINDSEIRNQMDLFENENFQMHELLFSNVALYFDAVSHNFEHIKGISINHFKENLRNLISEYKKKYITPTG